MVGYRIPNLQEWEMGL